MPNDKDRDAVNYEITEVDMLITQEIVSAFVMKQHIPSIIARIRGEASYEGRKQMVNVFDQFMIDHYPKSARWAARELRRKLRAIGAPENLSKKED
jgi:hypothetical protein